MLFLGKFKRSKRYAFADKNQAAHSRGFRLLQKCEDWPLEDQLMIANARKDICARLMPGGKRICGKRVKDHSGGYTRNFCGACDDEPKAEKNLVVPLTTLTRAMGPSLRGEAPEAVLNEATLTICPQPQVTIRPSMLEVYNKTWNKTHGTQTRRNTKSSLKKTLEAYGLDMSCTDVAFIELTGHGQDAAAREAFFQKLHGLPDAVNKVKTMKTLCNVLGCEDVATCLNRRWFDEHPPAIKPINQKRRIISSTSWPTH